jgi:hypothetical protein
MYLQLNCLIRMRFSKQTALLFAPSLILAGILPALGSAISPCVKATSSKNGAFLVISDIELEPGRDHENGARVQQVTLQVFPRKIFVNAGDRLTSQGTPWDDWLQWSVILDSQNTHPLLGCPLPLITDDGEFLVIVTQDSTSPDSPALLIYRRRDHPGEPVRAGPDHGAFVKDITLKEIWPAEKFPKVLVVNEATPLWFAGGTFEFSPDCRLLIHKTRWGSTVRINLSDGSVSMK